MTSKELYSQFALLEANLQQNKYLLDAIRSMSDRQTEITELHARALTIGENPHDNLNALNSTRNKLREIIGQVQKLKHGQIFSEINSVLESLKKAESAFDAQTSEKLNLVKKEIENFSAAYEKLISAYQLREITQLLSVAQRLDAALASSIEFTSITIKNLCPDALPAEVSASQATLEIYLSAEIDFVQFLEKTSALEKIYEELCPLFDVSPKQEPLKIIKIESGCLWIYLKGDSKVMIAIGNFIVRVAQWFYRNYTDEGKRSAIPQKVETIESVLHLSDELKKREILTDGLDEHIRKASNGIGKELEKLLAGEKQVELNGEIVALTPSSQQKLIANKQTKMIQEKNPEQ